MVVSALEDGDDVAPWVVRVGLISRLRRRLLGPSLKWECVDCGEVHRSNPKRCSSCGSTILRQQRDS